MQLTFSAGLNAFQVGQVTREIDNRTSTYAQLFLHVHGLWFKFSRLYYTVVHKNLCIVPGNMPTLIMNDECIK